MLFALSPILVVVLFIGIFDTGKPLFSQKRLGKNKREFTIYKLRTMNIGTKSVGSHEVSSSQVTKFGKFLRKSKIDELPQLFNVIIGDMSFVGPRPNLPNQSKVIEERDKFNIYKIRPGITGLAQINRIDMSQPKMLAQFDHRMIENMNAGMYFKMLLLTLSGRGQGDAVKS